MHVFYKVETVHRGQVLPPTILIPNLCLIIELAATGSEFWNYLWKSVIWIANSSVMLVLSPVFLVYFLPYPSFL